MNAVTFTDFSQVGRKSVIAIHGSKATAARQFKHIKSIYNGLHGHHVWTEDSCGHVLHDTDNKD